MPTEDTMCPEYKVVAVDVEKVAVGVPTRNAPALAEPVSK